MLQPNLGCGKSSVVGVLSLSTSNKYLLSKVLANVFPLLNFYYLDVQIVASTTEIEPRSFEQSDKFPILSQMTAIGRRLFLNVKVHDQQIAK